MSSTLWPLLAAERTQLADYLTTLSDEDWKRPTACTGWTVRDVAAHVAAGSTTTPLNFFPNFATSGFSFARLGERGIRKRLEAPNSELSAELRSHASTKSQPAAAYLGEVFVHGEDIRNAVGAPAGDHAAAVLTAMAGYFSKTGGPVGGKRRAAGLTLAGTDHEWTFGSGPTVTGPLVSIVMAICGRAFALDALTGDGVDQLRARI